MTFIVFEVLQKIKYIIIRLLLYVFEVLPKINILKYSKTTKT
jgi:hypothetical protein